MSEAPPALLETGGEAAGRFGPERAVSGQVPKRRRRLEDGQHAARVVFVVGGGEEAAARPETRCGEGGEFRLHQTAFVVPGLGPRVREIEPDFVQRALGEAAAQRFPGVAEEDPHVLETAFVGAVSPLAVRAPAAKPWRVAASRSHADARTEAFIHNLGPSERISIGSSLKFCLVAEGAIDVYPRFGPTCEWDTAAAQCVAEEAGGRVTDTGLAPLRYNTRESLLNPYFLVFGDRAVDWRAFVPAPDAPPP